MKDKLQYILFIVVIFGTATLFIFGSGPLLAQFGVKSEGLQRLFGLLGLVAGYFIAKGIWGNKK